MGGGEPGKVSAFDAGGGEGIAGEDERRGSVDAEAAGVEGRVRLGKTPAVKLPGGDGAAEKWLSGSEHGASNVILGGIPMGGAEGGRGVEGEGSAGGGRRDAFLGVVGSPGKDIGRKTEAAGGGDGAGGVETDKESQAGIVAEGMEGDKGGGGQLVLEGGAESQGLGNRGGEHNGGGLPFRASVGSDEPAGRVGAQGGNAGSGVDIERSGEVLGNGTHAAGGEVTRLAVDGEPLAYQTEAEPLVGFGLKAGITGGKILGAVVKLGVVPTAGSHAPADAPPFVEEGDGEAVAAELAGGG